MGGEQIDARGKYDNNRKTIFLETILKKFTHTSGTLMLSVVLLFSANPIAYAVGDAVAGKEKRSESVV